MKSEPQVGLHISSAESLELAFDRAKAVGANTFQIFTRNPRTWKFKPLTDELVKAFHEARRISGMRSIVAHMPYLPNLASPDKTTKKISRYTLDEEVKRCDSLGIDYLVTHLGSHLGAGTVVGIKNVSEAVNHAIDKSNGKSIVLLENMAGQHNSVGSRFEELDMIIGRVEQKARVGVCLDLCHAYAAGFDFVGGGAAQRTMEVFEETVGLDNLKVVHLNDSKGTIGSNLDRHEFVGEGKIGRKGIRAFLHYPGVPERPLIMETPFEDEAGMRKSLKLVRTLLK